MSPGRHTHRVVDMDISSDVLTFILWVFSSMACFQASKPPAREASAPSTAAGVAGAVVAAAGVVVVAEVVATSSFSLWSAKRAAAAPAQARGCTLARILVGVLGSKGAALASVESEVVAVVEVVSGVEAGSSVGGTDVAGAAGV